MVHAMHRDGELEASLDQHVIRTSQNLNACSWSHNTGSLTTNRVQRESQGDIASPADTTSLVKVW